MTVAGGARVLNGLAAVVVVFAALWVAEAVFAPIAFALFVVACLWPLQTRLEARFPRLLATLLGLATAILVVGAFGYVVVWGFGRVGHRLVAEAGRFVALYEQAVEWLEYRGIGAAGLWGEYANVGLLIRLVQEAAFQIRATMSFSVVVLVYVMLVLLEANDVGVRLGRLGQDGSSGTLVRTAVSTARKFRTYMLVRSAMSITTGVLVWALTTALGLELSLEWGVIAFVLNYIPFIGSFIATILPSLFALVQFGSWQLALVTFACLNAVQFAVGSFLEPRIAGKRLRISPSLVLFSVFFWTFLWGIAGALIGVPIMIVVLTALEETPSTRWIADLLSGQSSADDERVDARE
jgi:predicted PurR-regulated permease PerM